ncbi:MAG TPA: stage II sporulation protein M [Solirubrobacteraceae bacterium]|nr:stage II sporulation protein M [Solirubrobacteraceae bacterium]
MKTEQLAVVQGWADTRGALRRWNARPSVVLGPWALASLAVGALLLAATWAVASLSTPDPSGAMFPGVTDRATLGDYGFVLFRNGLVLALHSLACVAGFMAGSSLPQVAEGYSGIWRRIHELAGPLAIGFVGLATLFSLFTQAYALGGHASTLAADLDVSPFMLVVGILPHALPELFALFLPLAAWTLASRAGRWEELLAATFVTTAIAIPILLLAGAVEVWVSPRLLLALSS